MKKKIISLLLTNIIGATIIFNSNISCKTNDTSLKEINKFPDNYISPFLLIYILCIMGYTPILYLCLALFKSPIVRYFFLICKKYLIIFNFIF